MAVVGVGLGYVSSGETAAAVNGGMVMRCSMFGGICLPHRRQLAALLRSTAHLMPTYWITRSPGPR